MVFGHKWRRNWQLLSFVLRLPLLIVAGEGGGGGGTSDLLLVLGGRGEARRGRRGKRTANTAAGSPPWGGTESSSSWCCCCCRSEQKAATELFLLLLGKRDSSVFSLYRGHTEKSIKSLLQAFSFNDYCCFQHLGIEQQSEQEFSIFCIFHSVTQLTHALWTC